MSPVFILITLLGNGHIIICGLTMFMLEHEKNTKMKTMMDGIWWAFSTATTTGYGDITPVTTYGKILGILLMLSGMALFSIYTGLFADAILKSDRFRGKI
jgi:voltage-gated potassium channel